MDGTPDAKKQKKKRMEDVADDASELLAVLKGKASIGHQARGVQGLAAYPSLEDLARLDAIDAMVYVIIIIIMACT